MLGLFSPLRRTAPIQVVRLLSLVVETLKAFRLRKPLPRYALTAGLEAATATCLEERKQLYYVGEAGPVRGLGVLFWFGSIGNRSYLVRLGSFRKLQQVPLAPGLRGAELGSLVLAVGLTESHLEPASCLDACNCLFWIWP